MQRYSKYLKDNISFVLPILFLLNCLFVIPNFKNINDKLFFSSYALFNRGPQKSLYDLTWTKENQPVYFLKDVMPQLNKSFSYLYSISNKLRNNILPNEKEIKSLFIYCKCTNFKVIKINSSKSEYLFDLKNITKSLIKEYQLD